MSTIYLQYNTTHALDNFLGRLWNFSFFSYFMLSSFGISLYYFGSRRRTILSLSTCIGNNNMVCKKKKKKPDVTTGPDGLPANPRCNEMLL